MIVDRYDPMKHFELVTKLELEMEPELARHDGLLDDDVIFERVRADFRVRHPNSAKLGCHSTPAAVILRMLVVKRLYGFSYEQTERFASGSIVLGQCCRLYLEAAPDDTTLIRWANTIGPETVASLNDRVVELARSLKVTRGRKLRLDATVVETNVHHPTDSRLLGDGVRVVSPSSIKNNSSFLRSPTTQRKRPVENSSTPEIHTLRLVPGVGSFLCFPLGIQQNPTLGFVSNLVSF